MTAMVQEVNLYRFALEGERTQLPAAWIGKIGLAVAAGLLLVYAQATWQASGPAAQLGTVRTERKAIADQVAALQEHALPKTENPGIAAEVHRLRDVVAAQEELVQSLQQRSGGRDGFSSHMSGLARRTVRGLWLSSIEITDGGRALALTGHALRPEAVPELLEGLRPEPAFVGLAFRTFRVEESDEAGVLDFRIDSASEEDTTR